MRSIPGTREYGFEINLEETAIKDLLNIRPPDITPNKELSYCRNVFVPLTTACRYTCTYCTYFDPPGEASLLSPAEIRDIVQTGVDAGCTEALLTFGDAPDERYGEIYEQLEAWGHDTIHEYLREACEITLDEGLLPHSNPGDQTREQMELVADVNASMGVMLETTAQVGAHAGPRQKTPEQRLNTIRIAGELRVPFTTGILVGIGETWHDRAESILAIRKLHERYGHIQEVIVQPVVDNKRWTGGSPDIETLRRTVAMARYALPDDVSVQVPPNLAPARDLFDCGIDDLGGVSPVTTDHINPDYEWPALEALRNVAEFVGVPLSERLPVYERFIDDEWLSSRIQGVLESDRSAGRRYRAVLSE